MSVPLQPRTLFEKIWSRHRVTQEEDGQILLYVDQHLLQDGSAPAFEAQWRAGGGVPRTGAWPPQPPSRDAQARASPTPATAGFGVRAREPG